MSRPLIPSLLTALVLTGGAEETTSPTTLTEIDASDAISIQLDDAVGNGIVRVPIRQVNSYGIGVPGGTARLAIKGGSATFQNDVVTFDDHGYATAKVSVPVAAATLSDEAADVSRAFPSWNRSMLTEIYLCHAWFLS